MKNKNRNSKGIDKLERKCGEQNKGTFGLNLKFSKKITNKYWLLIKRNVLAQFFISYCNFKTHYRTLYK